MPSNSLRRWQTVRRLALNEIAQAHVAVGGTARGRRYTTQQINRAYAMLLASEFQGFCRDLHSECVDHLLRVLRAPLALETLVQTEFIRSRQLDRGNAQSSSLGADFGRLGIGLWDEIRAAEPAGTKWQEDLERLIEWRNAIAHNDFTSLKLRGIINLRLAQVRVWRASCRRLARTMDQVLHRHLQTITGAPPW